MNNPLKKYLLYFLLLVYFSGAIGFIINPVFFSAFTPLTLLLTSFTFLIHQPLNHLKYVLGFVAIAFIGFISEVTGVKTGLFFGNYYYGNALGYKIFGVPLVISLNWALLVNCGVLISNFFSSKKIYSAFVSASIITLVDYLMEQVVSSLDFWYFYEGKAGFHNYAGWFLLVFSVSWLFQPYLNKGSKNVALIILGLQVFFFGFIYLANLFNFL